jgi:hypothetical protein
MTKRIFAEHPGEHPADLLHLREPQPRVIVTGIADHAQRSHTVFRPIRREGGCGEEERK